MCVGEDMQVGAPAHRFGEIAHRRADPLLGQAADRHRAIAVRHGAVHVRDEAIAVQVLDRLDHRAAEARPLLAPVPAHGDRPIGAVQRAGEIQVALEPAIVGQDIVPAPSGRAGRDPFPEIPRHAAQRDHRVDRGAAAHDPGLLVAPRHGGIRVVVGHRREVGAQMRPEIIRPEEGEIIGVADIGRLPAGRMVRPGFEQQDIALRILAQPARQHATGGAAADDNTIPDHREKVTPGVQYRAVQSVWRTPSTSSSGQPTMAAKLSTE